MDNLGAGIMDIFSSAGSPGSGITANEGPGALTNIISLFLKPDTTASKLKLKAEKIAAASEIESAAKRTRLITYTLIGIGAVVVGGVVLYAVSRKTTRRRRVK